MEPVLLYITAASREEAMSLAHTLVSERLIACANVVDGATSLYWWQGAVEQSHESLIIAKTEAAHVDAVAARVKTLHSYSCPCVVAVPITGGNTDYLQWIRQETTRTP